MHVRNKLHMMLPPGSSSREQLLVCLPYRAAHDEDPVCSDDTTQKVQWFDEICLCILRVLCQEHYLENTIGLYTVSA